MAGPVAGVVFSRVMAPSWRADVQSYIDAVASSREGDDFWVSRMALPGCSYDGTGRPFILGLDDRYNEWTLPWVSKEPLDCFWTAASFQQAFGQLPDHTVSFAAMCNDIEDHYILGGLLLVVAERLGGAIDIGGLILPASVSSAVPGGWRASWDTLQPGVQAFTRSMPGVAIAAPYKTAAGHEWASHMVDLTFFRAWMQHPEFRMIK